MAACGGAPAAGDASVGDDAASIIDAAPPAPFEPAFDDRRQCMAEGELWEVCFDGTELPGQGVHPHLAWDNPIDDTWWIHDYRVRGVRINRTEGATTFLHANTIADAGKAWFLFRDPELHRAQGVEVRVRMRVLAGSSPTGVAFSHFDEGEEFSLHFKPTGIVFHSIITPGDPSNYDRAEAALDLTTWQELQIQKLPGSSTVTVRRRTGPTTFATVFSTALTAADHANSGFRRPFTETLFGATARGTEGGIYHLDFLHLRRLARPPGTWPATIQPPQPVANPTQTFAHAIAADGASCTAAASDTFTALATGGDVGLPCQKFVVGIRPPDLPPGDLSRCMTGPGLAPALSDGLLRGGTAVVNDRRIQLSQGSTFEMRFRFATPLATGESVGISGAEGPGAFGLELTSSAVIARSFGKPQSYVAGKYAPYVSGWNTLRIVRPANSIYAYVYLNGTLVLRDYKLADREDYRNYDPNAPGRPGVAHVRIGSQVLPASPTEAWSSTVDVPNQGWGESGPLEVDCLRWAWTAHAP